MIDVTIILAIIMQFIPAKFIWCKGYSVTSLSSPNKWRWCSGNFSGTTGVSYDTTTLYLMSLLYALIIVGVITTFWYYIKQRNK